MSADPSIESRVVHHLVAASDAEIEPGSVVAATRLKEDLDLSSLQAITLVMDLEDEFGITVEDEELEGLAKVGDIFELIEGKRAAAD